MGVRHASALVIAVALLSACIIRSTSISQVSTAQPGPVTTPARLHLLDGSIALVRSPWTIARDTVLGSFAVYDPRLQLTDSLRALPLDRVAGIETYIAKTNSGASIGASVLATGVAALGTAALAVAIFGSCPTVYSDSAGVERLESEGFSYSLAPLLEARDVDLLRARPGADGRIRLTVRNEAAETHYINHIELLAVQHADSEAVAPDATGLPLALGGWVSYRATDRDGRNAVATLAEADSLVYASDSASFNPADTTRLHDWISITLPAVDADSVAILLRARNSLFTTVLLYDQMLARRGAHAVDWIGRDLADIGSVLALSRWYSAELGMHLQVRDGAAWRDAARLGDPGPIAWEETAVVVPVRRGVPNTVRLWFPTDAWRIDRVRVAANFRRPRWRAIAAESLRDPRGIEQDSLRAQIAEADDAYLVTQPGDAFTVDFPTRSADDGDQFLLAMQGYYIEWIRPAWAARPDAGPFMPGNDVLRHTLERWQQQRNLFEQRFFGSRLAVR